jgi:hypothetical protein
LLELPAVKAARAVLRGPGRSNALRLPDHHDIEVEDEAGKPLARQRLPEGLAGISRLHALIAACMPAEWMDLAEGEAAGW